MVTASDNSSFVGGALCLDFCNTLDGSREGNSEERLTTYEQLARWSRTSRVISLEELRGLLAEAEADPDSAQEVLRRAIDLREAIYRLVTRDDRYARCLSDDLGLLNTELSRGMGRARVRVEDGRFRWGWADARNDLGAVLAPLARDAADLLDSGASARIRVCDGERCTWLFVDTTRNHRRRWCDMRTCGNSAKVRRYRRRKASS